MTCHMCCGSMMRCILRARRSISGIRQYYSCIGFYLSNFSFVHLLLQVFQQETLSSSNTDVIFLGKYRYHVRRDKNEHHASAMDQLKGFRTFAMRTLLRAAHCLRRIQQHEHFVSLAVRAPLWAAHCRVASDCPSPSLPCNA